MKKNVFFVILSLVFFVLIIILILNNRAGERYELEESVFSVLENYNSKDTLTIAACPTFYYMLDKIESNEGIETVKTENTSEALRLLAKGTVDLVISGRALKSDEPKLLSEIIGPGYDFIFNKEVAILEEEMQFTPFYTDLSPKKIIADFEFISDKNLTETEDIYGALDKGIVITALEDELRGETVYVFKENGERVRLSRLPRLYYSLHLEKEVNFIKEIIKNKL